MVQVQVTEGLLQGKECKTFYGKKYYSFEGIPYAKPPVGKLRFKAPEKPESWTGIRDATKPGNKCCQLNPYSNTSMEGSEDCLYLNVYTPSLPQEKLEKLPVIFFVHGGRLIFGYGDYYKPDYLIKNDVILVTINYRLNILGFLCLNIPEVPGNAGLKDTVMALRWVKQNIRFFNGDSNNVTVMGESAGGGMAGSYLTSKMADGLYHKVILQSGVCVSDLYMIEGEDPIEKARSVAVNMGNNLIDPHSLYEFLVNAPIEDLIIAFSIAELSRPTTTINAYFLPVVEMKFDGVERFFDNYPRIDIMLNRYNKVPMLIGMNSHESGLFLQRDADGNVIFEKDFYFCIPRYAQIKRDDEKVGKIERRLREFYFGNKDMNDETKENYIDMTSDCYFNLDITHMVELVSKYTDTFFYKFEYLGNLNTRVMKSLGVKGTCHGDMIQYQFYRIRKHEKCSEKDLSIIDMLSEAWCSFAKTGSPSWSNQKTKWLPYTPVEKQTLIINDEVKLVKNPDIHRYQFWMSLIGESSKL